MYAYDDASRYEFEKQGKSTESAKALQFIHLSFSFMQHSSNLFKNKICDLNNIISINLELEYKTPLPCAMASGRDDDNHKEI